MWGGGHGVAYWEEVADGMAALRESSIDSYSVIRSAYAQARQQSIEAARGVRDEPDEPESEDEDALAQAEEL